MSTKLVVSVDGLLLTNQNTIVSSRSIEEVILVGTSTQFNNLTSSQRTQILNRKNSNIGNASLSVALANESSASLDDEFYNFLSSNSLTFFNDPGLQSLSSSIVLTSDGSETFTEISADNFASFNSSSLSSNSLYIDGGSLSLGSNFGSKPTISLSSPDYLDDLSDSIVVSISAADFTRILEANTDGSKVSVSDVANIYVFGDDNAPPSVFKEIYASDIDSDHAPSTLDTEYDGTNRIPNTLAAGNERTTIGDTDTAIFYFDEIPAEVSVLEALRFPLMGIVPYSQSITLEDSADHLVMLSLLIIKVLF